MISSATGIPQILQTVTRIYHDELIITWPGWQKRIAKNMKYPGRPGPGAPPRYVLPGPAYSPAEAAEERFRQKIQAERAAEKDAYETKFKREQAAAEAAEAAKTAEAAP